MLGLLFPPKCILCRRVLRRGETDLCGNCREDTETWHPGKRKLQFLDSFAAVWYYEDSVRSSLLRYKFGGLRAYGEPYGRLLADKLRKEETADVDMLVWIPISRLRRLRRGYDQVELIARTLSRELDLPLVCALKKIRHTRPQSRIKGFEKRRANVLGAYRVTEPVEGKNILLLDDIVTTGATASECARVLLTAGAGEVIFAAVAAGGTTSSKKVQ